MPEVRTPAAAAMWVVGVLVLAIVARIGWELGGRLWGVLRYWSVELVDGGGRSVTVVVRAQSRRRAVRKAISGRGDRLDWGLEQRTPGNRLRLGGPPARFSWAQLHRSLRALGRRRMLRGPSELLDW